MSDHLPGTPPLPGRHEPPPVPPRHEPPPVPGGERELAIHVRHEPPPVPETYEKQRIGFVLEGSNNAGLAGTVGSDFQSPLDRIVEIESEPTSDELIVEAGLRPTRQPSSFLPWFALSLALLCIPPSIVAALVFLLGFELWPFVLICSLLAVCFGRYARDRGGPSANLAGLAVQLGRGFFAIGLVGLVMIGLSVAMWGIAAVRSVNKSWQESNRSVRWVTDKVDAVEAYFSGQGHKAPPALPLPSPNSSPAP